MKKYVSEYGFDSDQCGPTTETACKTVYHVLEQLHAMNSFINQDLLDQVKDVWRTVFEPFQSIDDKVDWYYYFLPPFPWQNTYVFHIKKLFRFDVKSTYSVADPGFPRGGGANSPGGANIRFCQIFLKTA